MRLASMGNTNRLGYHASEETRIKLSVSHMGKVISPETCAKISASSMGRPYLGPKHQTPETLAKMSIAQKKQPKGCASPNWKGGPTPEKRSGYQLKVQAKRRGFGYVYLNAWFPGCAGHHVDNEQVIHMPYALHRSIFHRQSDGRGMAKINAVAYNYLFKQEVEAALMDKKP